MAKSEMSEHERREKRRRKRRNSQIGAYLLLLVVIAAIGAAVVCGIKYVAQSGGPRGSEQEETDTIGDVIDDLFASEPAIELEPEPTETIPEPTPEEKLEALVNDRIAAMPLEDKVAGLFLVTPESITGVNTVTKAGDTTKEALDKYPVGGIIYFTKNIKDKEQLMEMIENTELYAKYPLFFAIDEEGGTVSRLADSKLVDRVSSAQEIGQSGDTAQAYQAGTNIGAYLTGFGFNLDFAPVADVANVDGSVMQKRSYGEDASVAAPFVLSMMQGLEEQGVTACVKHFPGIGSTKEDTHDGLAVIDRTADELRACEFTVFKAAIDAGANMIMVSHAAAPSLTGDNTPSTMSEAVVTDILREELGFDGVIITDAMNMAAISDYYEADVAAISALKAGCDMILMPDDFEKAYTSVLQAVQEGVISEERVNNALRRIYRIKLAGQI